MRKILALYINELIKISKSISVIVITVCMVGSIVFTGLLLKPRGNIVTVDDSYTNDNVNSMKKEITNLEQNIEDMKAKIESETDSDSLYYYGSDLNLYYQRLYTYRYLLEKNLTEYGNSENYFIHLIIDNLASANAQIEMLKYEKLNTNTAAEKEKLTEFYSDTIEILLKVYNAENPEDCFGEYIEFLNLTAKHEITDENELNRKLEYNEKLLKIYKSNGYTINAEQILNNLSNAEKSLEADRNYLSDSNGAPLTPTQRETLKNYFVITEYKLDNELIADEDQSAFNAFVTVGMVFIIIMILILAGSSFSQEISTGSIKSLIIAPVKRWKIFVAKVASLLTVGFLMLMLLFITSLLVHIVFIGTEGFEPYVYAYNGAAHEISFLTYRFLYMLTYMIDIAAYIAFALMLSLVTRNTAVSVAVSLGVYFGGLLVTQILPMITQKEWANFLPFYNLGLTKKFFPFAEISSHSINLSNISETIGKSLNFSLIYVAVMLFCLLYTAYDSFKHRDL